MFLCWTCQRLHGPLRFLTPSTSTPSPLHMCRCRLAAAVPGPPPRPREKDDSNGQCLFIDGGQSEQEVKKGGWRGGAGGGWTERIQRENKQRAAKRRANKDTSDTSGVYVPAVQTLKSLQFPEGILSNGSASRLNCYRWF